MERGTNPHQRRSANRAEPLVKVHRGLRRCQPSDTADAASPEARVSDSTARMSRLLCQAADSAIPAYIASLRVHDCLRVRLDFRLLPTMPWITDWMRNPAMFRAETARMPWSILVHVLQAFTRVAVRLQQSTQLAASCAAANRQLLQLGQLFCQLARGRQRASLVSRRIPLPTRESAGPVPSSCRSRVARAEGRGRPRGLPAAFRLLPRCPGTVSAPHSRGGCAAGSRTTTCTAASFGPWRSCLPRPSGPGTARCPGAREIRCLQPARTGPPRTATAPRDRSRGSACACPGSPGQVPRRTMGARPAVGPGPTRRWRPSRRPRAALFSERGFKGFAEWKEGAAEKEPL